MIIIIHKKNYEWLHNLTKGSYNYIYPVPRGRYESTTNVE